LSKYWLFLALLALYLTKLADVGFVGPDEPRYASIGREMAHSGDWVTPRLDGAPWFEKPALLYWMTGAGHKLHLADEWAARLPLALASLAFLLFFYRTLAREFSARVALSATAILATSGGWVAYSTIAVTDLPMSVALGAAMLIAIFDTRPRQGYVAGALLGLAILAKGFVPVVLIAPVFLIARRKRLTMIAGCVVVAAPWYVLCAVRNPGFWYEFFWRQHVERFLHPTLQHVQPFWFYIPTLLVGLFPWTPLAALLFRSKTYDDGRIRFLVLWLLFGLAFFSYPQTKLPGYVLPLLPALAVILAVALDKAPGPSWWVGLCVILLAGVPMVARVLPDALLSRLGNAHFSFALAWPFLLVAGAIFWLGWIGKRDWAMLAAALATVAALAYVKSTTFPILDQRYSVRGFWRANGSQTAGACWEHIPPVWQYGLNYYAARPIPSCVTGTEPLRVAIREGTLQVVRE